MDNAYSDAVESLLHDHCTPAVVRGIEAGADASALWTLLHESGFADCLLPEAALTLHDVFPMLRVMGQYVLPVPLAQTMFARAVLHAAGAQIPDGPIALASVDGQARVRVADGATAQWFLIQHGAEARLVRRDAADVRPTGVHGDLTVSVAAWSTSSAPAAQSAKSLALAPGALRTMGAALHAAQLAGAMAHTFEMTLQYANDRTQFGRPIGKFQAIQHQVSVMAEHVAAARMAAQLACAADGWQPDPMRAAIGKFNTSDAVTPVTSIAHAVHGAIGITAEYDLQLLTRRLHAWRMADGSERYWAGEIGAAACNDGGGAVDLIRRWSGEAV